MGSRAGTVASGSRAAMREGLVLGGIGKTSGGRIAGATSLGEAFRAVSAGTLGGALGGGLAGCFGATGTFLTVFENLILLI